MLAMPLLGQSSLYFRWCGRTDGIWLDRRTEAAVRGLCVMFAAVDTISAGNIYGALCGADKKEHYPESVARAIGSCAWGNINYM